VFVGIHVDAATRTVPLIYEAKNAEGTLRVGQIGEPLCRDRAAEETLAIPSAAIVEEDGRPIAFVQVGGETFQKRDLTLGIRDGTGCKCSPALWKASASSPRARMRCGLASVSSAIPAHWACALRDSTKQTTNR